MAVQRASEGMDINQSLLQLRNVVQALAEKKTHIPYRNSNLTRVLQDSLGGNCKTTLIACIWGDEGQASETVNTCQFAQNMMKVCTTHQWFCFTNETLHSWHTFILELLFSIIIVVIDNSRGDVIDKSAKTKSLVSMAMSHASGSSCSRVEGKAWMQFKQLLLAIQAAVHR